MYGWAGKIIRVDLTRGKAFIQPLPKSLAINYLGARGINARILWDELPQNADPLGPENILILGAGPLNGTFAPSSGRLCVTTKSPMTNLYVRTSVGGHFAADLKLAGYDAIVLYGASDKPVYLWIDDEEVELKDATPLWGMNVRETYKALQDEIGDPKIKVATIGQGGENLVRFAAIMTSIYRAAARSGVGAVMGSKKLKAIALRGTGSVSVADPDAFEKVALDARIAIRNDQFSWPMLHLYGTAGLWAARDEALMVGAKNFQVGVLPGGIKLTGQYIAENYLTGREGCTACVFSCGRFTEVKRGPYAGSYSGGPELESIGALGARTYCANPEAVIKANELCNLYGLDTISTGSTIAFAMECYERGLIKKEDSDGIPLEWGSPEAIIGLIHKIAFREGFGDMLADGSKRAAERIGGDAWKYAVQAKGLENAVGDGRLNRAHSSLAFAVNPKGSDHLHTEVIAERGVTPDHIKLLDMLNVPYDRLALEGKARLVKWHEEIYCGADALGLCAFTNTLSYLKVAFENMAEMFETATGISITAEELRVACERIVNLEKAFNVREGATRKDDTLPWRMLNEPHQPTGQRITKEELDSLLDDYYELHGWDKSTSWPKREKLLELGLDDVAGELQRLNKLPK